MMRTEMKDLQQENELKLFRRTIQAVSEKHILPNYEVWEKEGNMPRSIWRLLGEEGLLCVDLPIEYGGLGAPYIFSATIIEEFNRLGLAAIAVNLSVHANIVAHYILNAGTEEQKCYYLPKMASGELIGAIAMTEPNAGSDLQGIQTTAKLQVGEENYEINGAKTFVSNGQHCDFIIAVTKTNLAVPPAKGTTLFIIDAELDGVKRGKNLEKIGLHACDTSELFFEEIQVSKSAILGELNKGFFILMKELPRERITLAVGAQGALESVLDLTIRYVKERQAFGQSIAAFQNTRFKIAEMMTEARVNRAFIDECLRLLEDNQLDTETASMAKLSSTEAQGRIVDQCLQLFGGYGYMREYPIARAFVDARIQRIYGGTSEIMKEIISRGLLGKNELLR